jgi:hypothetical protein
MRNVVWGEKSVRGKKRQARRDLKKEKTLKTRWGCKAMRLV